MKIFQDLNRQKGERGFTLIEILVVMMVMALLAGAGLASYSKFNSKRRVEQAALDFASYLKVQQKKADAGEKPAGCVVELVGYEVETIASDNSATADAKCSSGPDISQSGFSLGDRAIFSDNLNVIFNVLGKKPDITLGVTNVMSVNNVYKYEVEVSDGGVITVEVVP